MHSSHYPSTSLLPPSIFAQWNSKVGLAGVLSLLSQFFWTTRTSFISVHTPPLLTCIKVKVDADCDRVHNGGGSCWRRLEEVQRDHEVQGPHNCMEHIRALLRVIMVWYGSCGPRRVHIASILEQVLAIKSAVARQLTFLTQSLINIPTP